MNASTLRTRKTTLAMAATLALGAMAPTLANAAVCDWIPGAGSWNVAANWLCGVVPGAADSAVVGVGKVANVTAFQAATTLVNSGTVNLGNNTGLGLQGSNTNGGVINLNSVGNNTDLSFSGVASLNGSGSVNTSNTQANRIYASGASTLTLGAGQSIQGAAQIGVGTALTLINDGTIAATQSQGMTINSGAAITNNSVLRADGGLLNLQGTSFSQGASGTLNAINGSVVQLSNSSITGGSFSSASGGAVATAGGTFANTLSGVTNTGTFNVVNNSGIVLVGTLTNNGTINLNSAGNSTDIALTGSQSILGAGVINLSNTTANRIYGAGSTLTLGSAQTITGAGTLGAGSAGFALANQGTIIASSSAGLLINAAAGVTNTGTLRADGGTLSLQTTINSGGGAIEALNGSQVQLLNGAVINNANFSSSGVGSLITTVGGATVTLSGGTVAGAMTVANNSFLRLAGDLTYNGTLTMNSFGNSTDLILDGARTLSGAATIQMSNTLANRLYAANPAGDSLTLSSGVTLQGSGQLGANSALAITNNGSVIATSSAGLLVETTAGLTNNGVMRADGGTLQFGNVVVNSAGGSIEARNGSQVQLLNGSTINNANFSATGAGSLITTVGGATVTLGGGTVAGPMTVANNSFMRLTGDLAYNGTLTMNSFGNSTDLIAVGARTISGAANISLSNTTANRVYAATAADSLTFANGVTVQGAGQIGAGGATTVTNNGNWIANLSSGMTLNTSGVATNNNLIRADGASFNITNTSLGQSASGVLNAINGGSVVLNNGSLVTGGTFSTASGGQVVVSGGNTAAIAGVTNAGTLNIANNAFLNLQGGLANNGVFNMQSVGNLTDLRIDGNRSITGTGTINLSNTTANRIYAVAAGDSLTLGSGQTLQGAGQIGAGTQFNLTNNGTMLGNLSSALTFSSTGTLSNNNLVRADAGNVLITGPTTFGQTGTGVLSAINGGVVTVNGGASLSGGTLATTDTGQFTTTNGSTATIANLANTGTFNVVNNSFLRLQGTVTNTGNLNLNSVGNLTDLRIVGLATLAGNGTTTLSNTNANRVIADAAGAQLTLGVGQTLQGSGQLGAGTQMALVNQGTITANQSTALTADMTGGMQNAASGLMQATATGRLILNSALANAGTLAANGGLVNANLGFSGAGTALITTTGTLTVGANSTVGTLTHNGSAAGGLSLGASNITVSNDYTNANSGSGDSFNRRANVIGAGQILAGGNAAQLISGVGVTNGATTNATLTIGNMRVGANNYAINIGNSGATGPTLRGAIQTGVNGGLISDARLSGSATVAGNYNAGAPAGAGSAQNVGFFAAAAGALAPLVNQAINLRSNFDNIADQKLNIVLGAGAAAFNAAVGAATPSPVTVGNQRVGGSNSAALTVANTAAAGAFSEDLNASLGANGGAASSSGAVNGLLAGATSNAISVGVNTASAGAKTGTVTLNYQTAGAVNGLSNGLGTASVGTQTITVNGNVYQAATGAIQTAALNFGTLQVGQTFDQALVIRNTAGGAAGFVEDLRAAFGVSAGVGASQISGLGTMTGITAGNSSNAGNGAMTVRVTGLVAGVINGSMGVNYQTAGAVNGVSNGLGIAAAGSEDYGVQGSITAMANVINQANPVINTPVINFGAVRVGGAALTSQVSVTNQASAPPQAALTATGIVASGAPFTASGSFSMLAPGGTNNSSLVVGLNTTTAGNFTGGNAGSATISLVSDASNVGDCAPNCTMALASQNVALSGKVYSAATGQLATPNVDFGVVRVGDVVAARNVNVNNTGPASALSDTLRANLSGVGGPFTAAGSVAGISAQGSGSLSVGLNTASAGVFSQNGNLAFLSQNADMADIAAGADAVVQVQAQVNNLANADFDKLAGLGTLTQNGSDYVLDFGDVSLGSLLSALLQLDNDVAGPADDLNGSFDQTAVNDFSLSGWVAFSLLGAGQAQGGLNVGFTAATLGLFTDDVFFNGLGTNASDSNGLAQQRHLTIRANVIDPNAHPLPEPGSIALVLAAAVAGAIARRRRAAMQAK